MASSKLGLEGEAWPDAPGTMRSLPVGKELRVREIWRTGTLLDGVLPAIEATVVGIRARCPQQPRRGISPFVEQADEARLARAFTPVIPPLRGAPPMGAPWRGQPSIVMPPISQSPVGRPPTGRPPIDLPHGREQVRCVAKVLRAPYELLAESLGMVDDPLRDALRSLEDRRKEDLRDVIRLSGSPFVELSLLIFARSKMAEQELIQVRAFAPGGGQISGLSVSFTRITSDAQLPPRWVKLGGPWWDDVRLVRDYFPILAEQRRGWDQYLVQIKLPRPALIVDIGVSPLAIAVHEFGMTPPSFFLAVVEGLSQQEVQRESSDGEEAEDDKDGLEDALSDQQHALLLPNAEYRVVVRYEGQVGKKREDPKEDEDPDEIVVQRTVTDSAFRTFFTDREPPRSLEPWMLAQFPSPGELYHFYEETVVVVFATDDVLELYKVYDRELQAVARAASFRGSAGTPEEPLTHLLLTPLFERVEGAILSPWEATVRYRLGEKACLNLGSAPRHGRAVLPFAMDPLTDYVLDIELLDLGGHPAPLPMLPGEVGHRPLYQQNFSTSRYPTREAFAEAARLSLVTGRQISNFAPLPALSERVSDEDFDLALLDVGFEAGARPESPRITVLWNTDDPPQPLAILIETPEPAWRIRREPEPEYDESGQYIVRWILSEQLWLSVDELVRDDPSVLVADGGDFLRRSTGLKTMIAPTITEFRNKHLGPKTVPPLPPPPLPASFVDRFVHDASGTRTLAILKPGTRGRTVSLGLARNLHPLLDVSTTDTPVVLCEVDLSVAPWEELL